jgi:hypothetical protein
MVFGPVIRITVCYYNLQNLFRVTHLYYSCSSYTLLKGTKSWNELVPQGFTRDFEQIFHMPCLKKGESQ